jgi:hypothetical protein
MADVATAIAGRRTVPSIYFDLDTSVVYMTTGQGEWQILRPVAECGIVDDAQTVALDWVQSRTLGVNHGFAGRAMWHAIFSA